MIVVLKIIHLLSLAVAFGLTTANLLIFRYAASLEEGERKAFGPLQRQLSAVGLIAIVLLWITGVALYLLIWLGAPVSVWFWVKMVFVVALTGLAITARKTASDAIREGKAPPAAMMRQYAHLVAASALGAIVTAVIAFNA
jgi:uncharacterized membrane protein